MGLPALADQADQNQVDQREADLPSGSAETTRAGRATPRKSGGEIVDTALASDKRRSEASEAVSHYMSLHLLRGAEKWLRDQLCQGRNQLKNAGQWNICFLRLVDANRPGRHGPTTGFNTCSELPTDPSALLIVARQ